jgi:hypothetical protein
MQFIVMQEITVTEEDIRGAERSCPIVLAIKRVTGYDATIYGQSLSIYLPDYRESMWIEMPQVVLDFMTKHYTHQLVTPFSFQIPILKAEHPRQPQWGIKRP